MSVTTSSSVSGGRVDATAGPGGPQSDMPTQSDMPGPARTARFDVGAAWQLNPKVALRPEPFGALLYHFGTRKLSFLKNLTVVGIVQSLADHPSADAALDAAGIEAAERPLYLQALRALADSGMIARRPDA
ncbi:mycofactocin biosynthesis chaperone MftB [Gordonia sp. HNM0687]|uniref:Mycofactocin biosynthesis chaperone MftB n=1 Tax=Gordonia mangrovi TaxID=2665643 RepID=A0A6L7GKN8_9ACTN|nr:mycofactocin biosynthesis chaperone MftB [Gordonia mangrovi]MXP20460.1 mycofactocin biosynthesis chaperone MftB [Gordonia mangrovi]UVF78944.1 mycofactocin biosynthesis chaperone MftB [Gordonia mangrovi]